MFTECTFAVPPPTARGFFRLPREIRDLIYAFVLVEPPKWRKHHDAHCDWAPRDATTPERPPWSLQSRIWKPEKAVYDIVYQCRCARRKGLGLLRANRQIHAEAAPIFWSRNLHCFTVARQLASELGELRPAYRDLIRYVSIMDEYSDDSSSSFNDAFWATLLQCDGLRQVEVRPELCSPRHFDSIVRLRQLPHFSKLRISTLLTYTISSEHNPLRHTSRKRFNAAMENQSNKVHFRVSRAYGRKDFRSQNDARELVRDFTTNHVVRVRFAVRNVLLHQTENNSWVDDLLKAPYLDPSYTDTTSSAVLQLRHGGSTTVHIYGLPLCRETRVRHARERYVHEQALIAKGLPTPREEELRALVRERRREKLAREAKEETCRRGVQLAVRQKRNVSREAAELKRESEEREAQRREKRRVIESAKLERRNGRGSERALTARALQ